MSTIFQTESSKVLENPEKTISGADVGSTSASEKLRRMVSLKRRDSESSTDIDRKTNDRVVNSERSALVRGSDPP